MVDPPKKRKVSVNVKGSLESTQEEHVPQTEPIEHWWGAEVMDIQIIVDQPHLAQGPILYDPYYYEYGETETNRKSNVKEGLSWGYEQNNVPPSVDEE